MRSFYLLVVIFLGISVLWVWNSPHEAITISSASNFSDVPLTVQKATAPDDYLAQSMIRQNSTLPPYDEVVLIDDERRALVTAVDGWFWEVDLGSGNANQFVDAPLMPAGARLAPNNNRLIYFCASRLYGAEYPPEDRVGLYQLNIEARVIQPIVLDVPLTPATGGEAIVYQVEHAPSLRNADISPQNSRPLQFCNDLDVSADGLRIYFTEPFSYGEPSMGGGGTYREALSLGRNGRVWRHDLDTHSTSLVAQNFTFPDGILMEGDGLERESSILVSETVKFKIVRLFVSGDAAGTYQTVIENLPGMPDGLDRDSQGRIWVGLLKQRSSVINWIHRNSWIKPLLLRLPSGLMPVSPKTSILALNADGGTALFYSEHDGSKVTDISVVIPGESMLYLATVGSKSRGFYKVPYPAALQN